MPYKDGVDENDPQDTVWAEDPSVGLSKVTLILHDRTDYALYLISVVQAKPDVVLELGKGLRRPKQGQDHEEQVGKEGLK